MNYQWQSIDGKMDWFYEKKIIWMEILNDIACNLNWIQISKLNSYILNHIQIQLKRYGMQIGVKGIENLLVTMVY